MMVSGTNVIYQKLEKFINKYYVNELIRGLLLFTGLGLLYFLFILIVEYFLWLRPNGRAILFCFFLVVEVYLLLRFICFPIFKLCKLKKGIDYGEAAIIIGNHFKEVKDKLLNYIQLSEICSGELDSDLLEASIDQRAADLKLVAFSNAVDFKVNKKYVPFAVLPILLLLLLVVSGNNAIISQSLNRVLHYKKEFSPPAPFKFIVINSKLEVEENKDFVIRIRTEGNVIPENAIIYIDGESYFMEKGIGGYFQYRISKPLSSVVFHFEANDVASKEFKLNVLAVPTITNFVMELIYPSFLGKKTAVLKGSGDAVIPEGTVVSWKISTASTQKVELLVGNSRSSFKSRNSNFILSKKVSQSTDYQIYTSNSSSSLFEILKYKLIVIKDEFPTINAQFSPDRLKTDSRYIIGQVGDDYGVSRLQVVYYDHTKPSVLQRASLPVKSGVFDQFIFNFPSALNVKEGIVYDYYFEVFDNDVLHHFKSSKSEVFTSRIATKEEKSDLLLQQQNDNVKGLQRSLKNEGKQLSQLEKLQNSGKEKERFDFNDQEKVNDFVQQQKKQDQIMREFADKLKTNLDKETSIRKDQFKESLKERIEKVTDDLDKNKKLLEELKSLNDKLNNEELLDKIDKFKQNGKSQMRNLEQLVELTKKYYVQKKAQQIADKLIKLAEKQENLSDTEQKNTISNEEEIKKNFDKIKEEVKDVVNDNKQLKAPLVLSMDKNVEKGVDSDIDKAVGELSSGNKAKAKFSQKNAAAKMKKLATKMIDSVEESEMDQIQEDVKMLRQVLDNLLAFSLAEEVVLGDVRNLNIGSPAFIKNSKKQQDLRLQFKHIDDSLFAMSLRNPKFTDDITREVGNTQYNLDKAIESFADSKIAKGVSHQQYVIAGANKLGDFLSSILSTMQMQLSGASSGKPQKGDGQGMQLPDIIAKQQGLGDKIKQGMQRGKKPGNDNALKNGSSSGSNDAEGEAKDIVDIYKEQKALREALEKELYKQGIGGVGKSVVEQMKQVERDLLNRGFNNQVLQKVFDVKQDLLKMKGALQSQGEDNSRKSEVGVKQFSNPLEALPDALLEYLNSIEILNRQSLPLRSNYNRKVQVYFKKK